MNFIRRYFKAVLAGTLVCALLVQAGPEEAGAVLSGTSTRATVSRSANRFVNQALSARLAWDCRVPLSGGLKQMRHLAVAAVLAGTLSAPSLTHSIPVANLARPSTPMTLELAKAGLLQPDSLGVRGAEISQRTERADRRLPYLIFLLKNGSKKDIASLLPALRREAFAGRYGLSPTPGEAETLRLFILANDQLSPQERDELWGEPWAPAAARELFLLRILGALLTILTPLVLFERNLRQKVLWRTRESAHQSAFAIFSVAWTALNFAFLLPTLAIASFVIGLFAAFGLGCFFDALRTHRVMLRLRGLILLLSIFPRPMIIRWITFQLKRERSANIPFARDLLERHGVNAIRIEPEIKDMLVGFSGALREDMVQPANWFEIALAKPYKEMLSALIAEDSEAGILDRTVRKWVPIISRTFPDLHRVLGGERHYPILGIWSFIEDAADFKSGIIALVKHNPESALDILAGMGEHHRGIGSADSSDLNHYADLLSGFRDEYAKVSQSIVDDGDLRRWAEAHKDEFGRILNGFFFRGFGSPHSLESALGKHEDALWREIFWWALELHTPVGQPVPDFLKTRPGAHLFVSELELLADYNNRHGTHLTLRQYYSGDPKAAGFLAEHAMIAEATAEWILATLRPLARRPAVPWLQLHAHPILPRSA